MTRLFRWFVEASREPSDEQAVHFHAGPESQPVVCYDARCASPRLDV